MDLVLTSKIVNLVQPYLQGRDGGFYQAPPLADVGFHPNGIVPLTAGDGRTFVAQNAETRGELRFYTFQKSTDDGQLVVVDAIRVPRPWKTFPLYTARDRLHLVTFSKDQYEFTLVPDLQLTPSITHGSTQTLTGSGHASSSAIESPILARVFGSPNEHVLFIDSRRSVIRELFTSEDGSARLSDLYALPDAAVLLAAADLNGDGIDDVAVLGLDQAPLRLLQSNQSGAYELIELTIDPGYNQSALFVDDADSSSTLLIVRDSLLLALKFRGELTTPERRTIPLHATIGSLVLGAADINGDGVSDLLVGTTGRAAVPPIVLFGPVWNRLDELAGLLADPVGTFGLRGRPDRKPGVRRPRGSLNAPLPDDLPLRFD
jgi:hypothetical protein